MSQKWSSFRKWSSFTIPSSAKISTRQTKKVDFLCYYPFLKDSKVKKLCHFTSYTEHSCYLANNPFKILRVHHQVARTQTNRPVTSSENIMWRYLSCKLTNHNCYSWGQELWSIMITASVIITLESANWSHFFGLYVLNL